MDAKSKEAVAEVKLSRKRGFYDTAFRLSLSTETNDAIVRYTTNGGEPTLDLGFTYQMPVEISSTTVFRVAAFKDSLGRATSVGDTSDSP